MSSVSLKTREAGTRYSIQSLNPTIGAEVKRPECHARFRWRPNSVAFRDNRAGLHDAVRDYGEFPRVMERVLIAFDDIPHRVRA